MTVGLYMRTCVFAYKINVIGIMILGFPNASVLHTRKKYSLSERVAWNPRPQQPQSWPLFGHHLVSMFDVLLSMAIREGVREMMSRPVAHRRYGVSVWD